VISGLLANALAEEASAPRLQAWLVEQAPDVPSEEVSELAELLESYLRGVPSALDTLTAMAKERPYGRSVAFAAGQVLVYLVDEDDLFREAEFGALGLLDDAYLIYACLEALRFAFPDLAVPTAYSHPDGRSRAAVRSLLPAGVADALDRTCENLVQVAAALYSGGGQGSSAPEPPRSELRVGEALAATSSLAGSPGTARPLSPGRAGARSER
jgi:hypothetical protein